jgi:CheY-like chemotaxis protein
VLVVEDIGVIAGEIAAAVEALGCTVLGPVDSVAGALRLLTGRWPDAALLDVQLEPGAAAPIAEALRAAGVPYAVIKGIEGALNASARPNSSPTGPIARPNAAAPSQNTPSRGDWGYYHLSSVEWKGNQ